MCGLRMSEVGFKCEVLYGWNIWYLLVDERLLPFWMVLKILGISFVRGSLSMRTWKDGSKLFKWRCINDLAFMPDWNFELEVSIKYLGIKRSI